MGPVASRPRSCLRGLYLPRISCAARRVTLPSPRQPSHATTRVRVLYVRNTSLHSCQDTSWSIPVPSHQGQGVLPGKGPIIIEASLPALHHMARGLVGIVFPSSRDVLTPLFLC